MDPTYTTMDASGLFLTSSGLALDASQPTLITPRLYDPAIMSTPWMDPSGVQVAMLPDGTVVPVAISSADIQSSSGVWPVLTNLATTGIESFATQFQRWLNPASAPVVAVPGSPFGGLSPTTLLLLGVGAYFLFIRKR